MMTLNPHWLNVVYSSLEPIIHFLRHSILHSKLRCVQMCWLIFHIVCLQSHLFFVMKYLNGGDLYFHIQQVERFSINRAKYAACATYIKLFIVLNQVQAGHRRVPAWFLRIVLLVCRHVYVSTPKAII